MAVLPTLVLALAAVSTPAILLADVATACSNPSDIEGTKSALLNAGWRPISADKQAEYDKWISAIDSDDGSKTKTLVFEQDNEPLYLMSVSNRAQVDGSWFRSCTLKDSTNHMGLNLEAVKFTFGLENAASARIGPAYYWQSSDAKKQYMLVLPTSHKNETTLVIGIYGED